MNCTFRKSLLIGLLAVFALPYAAKAQEKIVYIDSYRIRLDYKEFQDAQAQFNKEVEQWNSEVEKGQKEIEAMEADLQKQALILSDAKKKEKETEIQLKKDTWQRTANDIFGPDGRAEKRNAELTKPLLDKINAVLEKVAIAEGYALILDTVNGNIAYGKKEFDITDKILEELEKTQ
jgi:outer membrane protein